MNTDQNSAIMRDARDFLARADNSYISGTSSNKLVAGITKTK